AAGLLLAVAAAAVLQRFLPGVGAGDPAAVTGAASVLAATLGLVGAGPLRRALRVDPVRTLRGE
ncbi:MAG TPA: hypothetical protein VMM93_00065, partial [Vicinamibacterales bacterium]|nr:hypothetical protein [Vicinamibacterales bacterium]